MTEIFFEKSDKVQVFIDDRELKSACARRLFELGAVLKSTRLDVGDYVLSERVCIERKTSADFESSIIDGRLFAQAKDLTASFPSPLIALIGQQFERVNPKALRGAFISLAVDYKLPMLFFENEEELADFIYAIGEREQLLEPREQKLRFNKRSFSLSDQQQFIVESLPMVGPKNAKALLRHFGSVNAVLNATGKDLQEVEGIGPKRAEEIKKVVATRYGAVE